MCSMPNGSGREVLFERLNYAALLSGNAATNAELWRMERKAAGKEKPCLLRNERNS